MTALRIIGLVVAVGLLGIVIIRYRRRRLTDSVIMGALAVLLGVLSVAPSLFDPLLRVLGFPPGNERRIIGVLVLSTILLVVVIFRSYVKTDRLEEKMGDLADRLAERDFLEQYGTEEPQRKLAIVIPALNEEGALPDVLKVVPEQVEGLTTEVIVVSDGSNDATERVARENGALVVGRDVRRGQGAAVRLGYRIGLLRGAEVVATVDADGQNDPRELHKLVKPILAGEADVVHGSRVLGAYERPLAVRSQGVKVFAWITSRLAKTRITDPASGFRAFSAKALGMLRFRENQFHASEVTMAAAKAGLRVKEVPYTFKERSWGETKKPSLLKYGLGYARSLIRTWLR